MTGICHTAKFSATDALPRILEDLVCPACGHQDPGDAHSSITDNRIRIFCDCCGAFVTILLSDKQALVLRRHSATLCRFGEPTVHAVPGDAGR